MNILSLIPSGAWIYLVIGALSAAFMGGWQLRGWKSEAQLAEFQLDTANTSELQRIANRSRSQSSEVRYVTQTVVRDRYITKLVKEIEYEAAPLATCRVPAGAVRVLNQAARCAREDRPAACGPDGGVSDTR